MSRVFGLTSFLHQLEASSPYRNNDCSWFYKLTSDLLLPLISSNKTSSSVLSKKNFLSTTKKVDIWKNKNKKNKKNKKKILRIRVHGKVKREWWIQRLQPQILNHKFKPEIFFNEWRIAHLKSARNFWRRKENQPQHHLPGWVSAPQSRSQLLGSYSNVLHMWVEERRDEPSHEIRMPQRKDGEDGSSSKP
jgi:hypothetical protein